MLAPFLVPLLWSIVLAITTWPALVWLRKSVPSPSWLAPFILTSALGVILVVVLVPLPWRLASELQNIGDFLRRVEPDKASALVRGTPFIGPQLADLVRQSLSSTGGVIALIGEHREVILKFATSLARGALSTVLIAAASLVGCNILYRCGDGLFQQLRNILERIGGESIPKLLDTAHQTVRSAAYSVLATAVAQGTLAGIGFLVSGAPSPMSLAVLSMIVSLIPFGTPLIYVPVSLYLIFFSGLPWFYGAGLLFWGVAVISTIDNLLRSVFISQATKTPPILVFIGVVGGIAAFGALGVFIGPAIIAVAQWLWLDFAKPERIRI